MLLVWDLVVDTVMSLNVGGLEGDGLSALPDC